MLYTNINIKDETRIFKYVVGYDENKSLNRGDFEVLIDNGNKEVLLFDENANLVRKGNYWEDENVYHENISSGNVIESSTTQLHLYFPSYSVETYNPDKEIQYALTISTWLYGYKIILGSYLISRLDVLACPSKKIFGDEYVEYIPINIINVHDFFYGDDWSEFRNQLKDQTDSTEAPCSMLSVDLFPINKFEDHFIVLDSYTGSQNAIQFTWGDKEEYLKFRIKLINNHIEGQLIGPSNLDSYLNDNCGFGSNGEYDIEYMCVLKNDTDIFSSCNMELVDDKYITTEGFVRDIGDDIETECWKWWNEYFYGKDKIDKPLIIRAIATIKRDNKPLMYLVSNDIPVTQELFSKLIYNENVINLEDINMNIYNIQTVNKNVQNIISRDIVGNDSKSNIIQPVFFKARDVDNLIIHPAVTENICINLDSFKSKVNRFIIQIEDCCFNEIGRTSAGVIFKIVGKSLPRSSSQGLYYILDENSELITNGNYKYIM